jgi:tRNA 2-selenouridine synthase
MLITRTKQWYDYYMELPQIDDYQHLFLNDVPLIDVRAPVEFSQGAFPNAHNLPLMENDERHQVGIHYKEHGQGEAIALGHELVSGNARQDRINKWASFAQQNPSGALYCFRGGLRSKISQQWIHESTGILYPRVTGGYKALRHFLLQELEKSASLISPVILGGQTGSGKTVFLQRLKQQVDLEGIFHHRGSAFGKHALPQPSQIDIENNLSITLLKHLHNKTAKLLLEDEAANIGSRRIPPILMQVITSSPLVVLEVAFEQRVNNIFQEYIVDSLAEYQAIHGTFVGFQNWSSNLLLAVDNIKRRLGGSRYQALKALMEHAIEQHATQHDKEQHREWITYLLREYYDPMYNYQLDKKVDRVIFRGEPEAVLDYLAQHDIT